MKNYALFQSGPFPGILSRNAPGIPPEVSFDELLIFHPFRNYTRNYSKDSSKKIARTILAEMSPMLSLGLLQGLNFNNFFKDFCKYFSNDKFRNAKISPDSHLWNFFNNNSGHFFKNSARDRDRFREFTRNSSTDSTLNYFMNSLSHTFKKITT